VSDDAATAKQRPRALAVAFGALCLLTAAELAVTGSGAGRSGRIAALVALLLAKAIVVLTAFMRAPGSRRAAWLTLAAIATAVGFAVVLVLEAGYRGGPP
jgi:heme/copper-type cytochrome/quinol oxidase subunit 4